jgi:putative ABC transport system permease protein
LNIAGLSVAFAVFYVITVQVYHDFSFDRNFEKADNIYYISKFVAINGERWTTTNTRTPKEIAQIFPEVKNYCFMMVEPNYTFDVPDDTENRREFAEIATFASEGFVDIFTPEVISGDVRRAFNTDWQGMLTESVAKKFFGDEDPLGKVFYFHNENNPIRVVAVCKDFPDNCSIKNGVFLNKHEGNDAEAAYTSYLEIIPGGKDKVLNTINNSRDEDNGNWKIVEPTEALELTALPDIHLKFPVKGSGSLSSTLSLMAIGIILLIIAYINFVNFSIAMAPVRLKGFNIRRILGENPLFLKFSIAIEAALFSFIAFLISIPIVTYLNNGIISDFFQADLLFSKNIGLLLLIGGISLATGFIAGIYPAFYSTAFSPAMALKGASVASHHSRILKNSLIVIQFVATICLVVVSVFIKIQHDYMQNKSWNIKTENVIYFPLWKINNLSNFRDELEKNPDIYGFTFSTYHPGNEGMGWGRTFENTEVKLTSWPVYYNYAEFFDVKIIAGRDFVREDMTGSGKIIFNQAFIKKYGLDKNIIGQEFFGFDMCEIIGIMEDFNFESLKEPIKPMAFVTGRDYANWIRTTFIRINGDNTPKTLAYIRDSWKQFSTEPVDINFLDETINRLYQQESNLAKLILIFGLITIIVSIMGVYGLILFDAKSKRKTIALHKVHGASKSEVILMLNRNLIIQFVIAYIIAVPLAYYVVNSWLEGFAYKTPIHWWVFILGGLIVFMISLATVSWQSYRAASINPVEAIKSE